MLDLNVNRERIGKGYNFFYRITLNASSKV